MARISSTSRFVLAILVFAAVGAHPVDGQEQPLRPGDLETDASRVFTFVKGTGMGHDHGVEAKLTSGRLVLGARAKAGQLVFDMKSFDADTPRARKTVGLKGKTAGWMRKQVNKEIHGSKILNSTAFPSARFDIVSAIPIGTDEESGNPAYELAGNFTLRDVTRPITVRVLVEDSKGWHRINGQFSFQQSDYGIKPLSKGLGAMGVADELTVIGELWVAPTAESLASFRRLERRVARDVSSDRSKSVR